MIEHEYFLIVIKCLAQKRYKHTLCLHILTVTFVLLLYVTSVFLILTHILVLVVYLKLQSINFASLSPSLFENLELQLLAELSSLRGMCSGTTPAWMNLMFWGERVAVSHRSDVDIYCSSQSQILAYVLGYMTQIRLFTVYCLLNK